MHTRRSRRTHRKIDFQPRRAASDNDATILIHTFAYLFSEPSNRNSDRCVRCQNIALSRASKKIFRLKNSLFLSHTASERAERNKEKTSALVALN